MSIDRSTPSSRVRPAVLVAMIVAAALARLLPHPPNFTPVGAVALFGGAYFASRAAAVAAPLAAMVLSDLLLSASNGWEFGWMRVVVYACLAASVWIGAGLRAGVRPGPFLGASLASASLFFVVTNFAVWAGGGGYPMSGGGLLACYVAAIPFFGGTLAGHVVYGAALFAGFELLQRRFEVLRLAPPVAV